MCDSGSRRKQKAAGSPTAVIRGGALPMAIVLAHAALLGIHAAESRRLKRVFEVFDGLAARRGPGDRDHVESRSAIQQVVTLHIGQSQARQPPLLGFIDRVCWMASIMGCASFHLDKHDRAAIDGDQINLTDAIAMCAGDDDIAELAQVASGGILAAATEGFRRQQPTESLVYPSEPTHGSL